MSYLDPFGPCFEPPSPPNPTSSVPPALCPFRLTPQDVVGVIRSHQAAPGATPASGAPITCRVLDVSKGEGIVDLSAHPDLLVGAASSAAAATPSKGKGKKAVAPVAAGAVALPASIKAGTVVEAKVELIKDVPVAYAIVSFAAPAADSGDDKKGGKKGPTRHLAFVALTDYNAAVPDAVKRKVAVGAAVKATIQVRRREKKGRLLCAAHLSSPDPPRCSPHSTPPR